MTDAQLASSRRTTLGRGAIWILVILLIVLINALAYQKLVNIDDAYISYRYAENLLRHGQLVYNLAGDKAFAATSPGYSVVLAALGALGLPIDRVGFALGALAIFVAGWAMMDLLRKWPLHAGAGAGLLLVLLPLSWSVIGMESVPVMAFVLASYALTFRGRHRYAAALLAIATIFRFDAVTAAGAWGLWLLLTVRLRAVRPIVTYGVATLAMYAALHLFLNVPLPTTLASKQAQVALGVTGFGPHTTYVSGMGLLAQAHTAQSPAYWLAGIFAVAGIVGALALLIRRGAKAGQARSTNPAPNGNPLQLAPVFLLALWTVGHLAAYLVLGVTPYLWYYLPFVPLVVTLIALGVTLIVAGLQKALPVVRRRGVPQALAALLWAPILIGPLASHVAIWKTQPELGGGRVPFAANLLLPGSQWGPYKSIGEWLRMETPLDASAGMMEIGIVGYVSQRPVVDFLGLLDTDIADALTRGDISWALYAQQPDYLVLGDHNPLYSYNVYQDRWFQTNYEPKRQEPNRVPGGSWFTVYERRGARPAQGLVSAVPPAAEPLSVRFGDALELVGMEAPPGPWHPEDPLGVTFYWKVLKKPGKDYTQFLHIRDGRGVIIAAKDHPPLLGARPTTQWEPGETIADFHPIALPPMPLAPTRATFELGFYDASGARLPAFGPDGQEIPGGQAQFGEREIQPAISPIRFGSGEFGAGADVAIQVYRLSAPSLTRGGVEQLELVVGEVAAPVQITAELWDSPGQRVIWQQETPVTSAGTYTLPLSVAEGEPANEGELRVRVSKNGEKLSWLDAAGHRISGLAPLTALAIGPR